MTIDAQASIEAVRLVGGLEPELRDELLNYLAGKHPAIVIAAIDYFDEGETL